MTLSRLLVRCLIPMMVMFVSPIASATDIKTVKVTKGIYMLTGKGGNIGLSVGASGVLLIDDKYAPASKNILAAIAKQTNAPVRFVINTHWHGDHTGGNENMGKAGAVIVAHENVRKAMSKDQFIEVFNMKAPASPEIALPVITFVDGITFHWNGDTIEVMHVAPAHTDGDSIIYFKQANVIHAGDTFFNKMYPFIDVTTGGSIKGMISATDKLLTLANDKTKIIPGHGPLADKKDLQAYRDMLITMKKRISDLKNTSKTRDDVIAAKPTAGFDSAWGNGFLKPDVWVGIVYDSLN
jgi:cyclase